uniref:non-specific serine/threonine protein kinase n=1 Tax=Steinernema glaseri TaxID=37863 RepID=A0A1I8AEH5_9BILA
MRQESYRDYYCAGGFADIRPGEKLNDKYFVIKKLGWGTFSTVWLCWHVEKNRFRALKVVKSAGCHKTTAINESQMLKLCKEEKEIVKFHELFTIEKDGYEHMVLVTEVLGCSLLKVMRGIDYEDVTSEALRQRRTETRAVAEGILRGLRALQRCDAIHGDIKPENILFTKPRLEMCDEALEMLEKILLEEDLPADSICANGKSSRIELSRNKRGEFKEIQSQIRKYKHKIEGLNEEDETILKLADLGSSTTLNGHRPRDVIQTLEYRSPEVITMSGYDYSADVFSAGCVLFEFATGAHLFHGVEEGATEQLTRMNLVIEELQGHPFRKGNCYQHLFKADGTLRRRHEFQSDEPVPLHLRRQLTDVYGWSEFHARRFADFLLPMLRLDPAKRTTPEDHLRHSWL